MRRELSKPALVVTLILLGLFVWVVAKAAMPDDAAEAAVTPHESAQFIWDQEADELEFCLLYWRLPYVEVVEDVFLVRASGVSNSDAVAIELANIAALQCPQPAGWTEDWIESQR